MSWGSRSSVHVSSWPTFDPSLVVEDTVTLVVQVDGKVRDRVEVSADIDEATALELARASENARRAIGDGRVVKEIVRAPKLVNFVTQALTVLVGVTPVTGEGRGRRDWRPAHAYPGTPRLALARRARRARRRRRGLAARGGVLVHAVAAASGRHRGTRRCDLARHVAGHRRLGVALSRAPWRSSSTSPDGCPPRCLRVRVGRLAGDRCREPCGRCEGRGADLTSLNLAAPLTDGTQIAIPKPGATVPGGTDPETGTSGGTTLININTASEIELEDLPGVGPVTAAAIIDYRTRTGRSRWWTT